MLLIHAADERSVQVVMDAFAQSGVQSDQMNIRWISPSTIRFWDRSNNQADNWREVAPDILSHVGRVSVPLSGFENEYEWYKNVTWPAALHFADNDVEVGKLIEPPLPSRYSPEVRRIKTKMT